MGYVRSLGWKGLIVFLLSFQIQDLKEEITQHQEAAAGSESRIQHLERDVAWKQDTVNELSKQVSYIENL